MAEPADMMMAVTSSMGARTGRSLEEWIALVEGSGLDPLDQKAVRAWLKEHHGVAQNSQWAIADALATKHGWVRPDVDGYADQVYAKRPELRPLHDAIVAMALGLGDDVEVQGRGTYIPLVRRTQFMALGPGPRSTLRVGFRYREGIPDDPRLEPAKGFAQATHWLHLPGDADPAVAADLEELARVAYENNG